MNFIAAHPKIPSSGLRENEDPKRYVCQVKGAKMFKKLYINMYLVRILNNRKRHFNSGKKWSIEKCDFGMQNCKKILESQESEVVERDLQDFSRFVTLLSPVRNVMLSPQRTTGISVWTGL